MASKEKSNFITICTNAFDKFVSVFKKNGLATVTYILLLFMIFYSFILNPININKVVEKAFDKHKTEQKDEKTKSEEQRHAADELLVPIMEEIAELPEVSRVLLFEKHNNSQNISGIDFLYLSATYETIEPSDLTLDYIGDNFQKQFITNFLGREIIALLRHKEYIYYADVDNCQHTSHRLMHKLKRFGAKSVMLVPFRDENHRPLLIMTIISNNGALNPQEIFNHIKPYMTPIKQALMK